MSRISASRAAITATLLLCLVAQVHAQADTRARDLRQVPDIGLLSREEALAYLVDVKTMSGAAWRALPQEVRCGHLNNAQRHALSLTDDFRKKYQQALDHMNGNPDMSPDARRSAELPAKTIQTADPDVVEAAKQLAASMQKPASDYASAFVAYKTAEVYSLSAAEEEREGLRIERCAR